MVKSILFSTFILFCATIIEASILSNIENIPDQYDKTLFLDAVNKVKEEIKLRKLNDLKKKVNELMTTDEKKANEYLSEYLKLLKELGGKTNGN